MKTLNDRITSAYCYILLCTSCVPVYNIAITLLYEHFYSLYGLKEQPAVQSHSPTDDRSCYSNMNVGT